MLAAPPDLTNREFEQLRGLIYRTAGIHLGDAKRALLVGRLSRRLRELGLASFDAYHQHVTREDQGELVHLLDAIVTNETHFFREPAQFELLGGALCEAWEAEADAGARERRLRVWSAACSSGEEPYSIAMILHDRLVRRGWSVEILASDISTRVLARARAAVWPLEKIQAIPGNYRREYLLRGIGPEAGRARVGPVARNMVRFERINLRDTQWPLNGGFDAIFCRNALIYFDQASRHQCLDRLLAHLAPRGHLFLGHAESLAGTPFRARAVIPAVYQVAGEAAA